MKMKLFGKGNPKTLKGESKGYTTYIQHLAPATLSGYNTCPMASKGCTMSCLNTSGRGRMTTIQSARIRKTRWFFEDRESYLAQMEKDILAGVRAADRDGMIPVFRPNGTSDIRWENYGILEKFPEVQFYDYTKIANRRNIPDNYHLTFSRSESNDVDVDTVMMTGTMNVAVVFNTKKGNDLPPTYKGIEVIDGDEHDLRFLDKRNVWVGLRAKGDGKKDTSGFVVTV
jgi:hypothetical protein